MKKLTTKNILIALGVSMILFMFYWTKVRPSRIKHYCSWKFVNNLWNPDTKQYKDGWKATNDDEYKFCLRDKGL